MEDAVPAEQLGQPGAGPVLGCSPVAQPASLSPALLGIPLSLRADPACSARRDMPASHPTMPSSIRQLPNATDFPARGNLQGLKRLLASSSVM